MTLYADVILPLPLDRPYTYSVPAELEVRAALGSRVLVPLGERRLTGFIVGLSKNKPSLPLTLKPVAEVLDEKPFLTPRLLSFTRKVSRSSLTAWGEILQAAAPPSLLLRTKVAVRLTPKGKEALDQGTLADEERQVAALVSARAHSPVFLEKKTRVKNLAALLARMRRKELITAEKELKQVSRRIPKEPSSAPAQLELDFSLDENLQRAAEGILPPLAKGLFAPFLLFGSADRREAVYFHLVRRAAAESGRVLHLVPEIAPTQVLIEKYKKRLGDSLAILHSAMTDRQREAEWNKIREGRVRVVVGPRSALFAPLPDVRLIILDEEQDETYSQQEGLPFDVRKAARIRAEAERAVLVLGSAAPTVETFYSARKGGFLIDLGREPVRPNALLLDFHRASSLIDSRLTRLIQDGLEKGEQAVLFYNRRSYPTQLACRRCGREPRCDRCGLSLVYHKAEGKLVCPSCRRAVPAVLNCPSCGNRLIPRPSAGVEAVAEELRRSFPGRRVEVFAAAEAARKAKREALLREFEGKEIDVLVGTHALIRQAGFPRIPLVGVLHPEMILQLADFRSGQKAFQAITSARRFLREGEDARLVIQTFVPGHYSIREAARGDYPAFFEQEIKFRRLLDYPPFSCLAEVFFSGGNLRRLAGAARTFTGQIKSAGNSVQVYGPALAPAAQGKELRRVQVTLRARRTETMIKLLNQILPGLRVKRSVFLSD
jgi:primosomal protein N' (replication factor Y) (superfamily II helicase)